jgi:toxin ParE1/3/4
MSRYVINALASQDLNEIADYFAENNVEAGDLFCTFNRKCQQLVAFPNSGKSVVTFLLFSRNLIERFLSRIVLSDLCHDSIGAEFGFCLTLHKFYLGWAIALCFSMMSVLGVFCSVFLNTYWLYLSFNSEDGVCLTLKADVG